MNKSCPCGKTVDVRVHVDADLSCSGKAKWRVMKIDKCIAPLVNALQRSGINMRSSCCGHGKNLGQINLSDERRIKIHRSKKA